MSRQPYPSDLTDAQWDRIEPDVPKPRPGGQPASVDRREIVDAGLYVVREGMRRRAVPHDIPAWKTGYHSFRRWRNDGTWQALHEVPRTGTRKAAGRAVSPAAAIFDAQRVKTLKQSATCRGHDGGKRVKGRKRHLAVDTLGLLLVVVITAANVGDRSGARLVVGGLAGRFAWLRTLFADSGHHSQPLADWLRAVGGWSLEIVRGVVNHESVRVEPKGWIVERTLGWLNRYGRLSKDDEAYPEMSEVMILIAMTHLVARRIRN